MKKLLTPAEVAEILGTTTGQLAQLRFKGTSPPYKRISPKIIRYDEDELREWIESTTRTQT